MQFVSSRDESSSFGERCGEADSGFVCGELAPPGDGAEDDKGLLARRDGIGQRSVGGVMREVLLAGEEAQESATLQRAVVANGPAQHGILGLERIEDRTN